MQITNEEIVFRDHVEASLGTKLSPEQVIKIHKNFKIFTYDEIVNAFEISKEQYFIEGEIDPAPYVDIVISHIGGIANNKKRYGNFSGTIVYVLKLFEKKQFMFDRDAIQKYLSRHILSEENATTVGNLARKCKNIADFYDQISSYFGAQIVENQA